MTTPTTAHAPLPPDLVAKATEAIADGIYEDEHSAVIAEKVLRAVDVPGLLAKIDSLREHLEALILENGLTASQLRARIQLLVQRPDGTPSARVRALIDANHALTQQRDEARAALAFLMRDIDAVAGVSNKDRYDFAVDVARERGHEEPAAEDELDGFLRLIAEARRVLGSD